MSLNLLKQFLRFALTAVLAGASAVALAQAQPVAGKDYQVISAPQNTDAPGKVEVVEFFWYGCPHCYNLEPAIQPWSKKLPKDVVFRRIPAMFNENWATAGRIFYTLEAMGELERLHLPLFDAIHKDNLRITSKSAFDEWLKKQNVDVAKFDSTVKSFAVEGRIKRATQLTQAYAQMDGVPALIVNGRYLALSSMSGSNEKLLATVDYLIGISREPAKAAAK